MLENTLSAGKKVETSIEVDKFHEIEIEKVFDAMLSTFNLRVQLGTFFATVNLAALSFAFSTQKSGIIIFSGLLLWVFIILDFVGVSALIRLEYRGMQLTELYSPKDIDNLYTVLNIRYIERIKNVFAIPDGEKRKKELSVLPYKMLPIFGFWFPLLISLLEIIAGFLFWHFFKWPLF